MKKEQSKALEDAWLNLNAVWNQMLKGQIDGDMLQEAVYCQALCNRIVWKANEVLHGGKDTRSEQER